MIVFLEEAELELIDVPLPMNIENPTIGIKDRLNDL